MVDPIYIALGERIRRRREKLELTQQQLADQVNLSRTSVTNIERGRQAVLLHQLVLFAHALDLKVTALIPSAKETPSLMRAAPEDEIAKMMKRLRATA
ncbi:helix-turn-helix domain-containing protein [Brevundimonas aveniformis]|uniref:helix-turn-helix domain-containing protein n=1 Tax=Brevundimonas aveniformis TaxID=370977 RepID=UPI000417694D|nr:helix-turn-helix transcriptional regulator [Brevundimonas aveniformis]